MFFKILGDYVTSKTKVLCKNTQIGQKVEPNGLLSLKKAIAMFPQKVLVKVNGS